MKKLIHTDHAPKALGPYSQAVLDGDTLFLSGQIGIEAETGKFVEGGVEAQTHRVLKNIAAVLEAAAMGMENIVKTTIYLASMEDFQKVNEIYSRYFVKNPPARATVEVARLPLGALVEIEAIARK
ncbi:MAG: reactive intermediate/imine deaminase [Candidatus Latescibacteria bacterium]|nr:reactive intermediate/imine deaminase [Candidatus Latescibacterota bacterium]NIM22182.1 reactive intermediate/imine deaminase [Candidatus Latescibacterota bacterium]NIM64732.1 reactive intermediate/imine deaminase [Candidatus Latescibacterota bacterium]NIO01242.1 reactive intermediate/imine deaminase [Candidatus Latescibacterota bacterium]NIO27627.1 reactive intermediate/imine deaminase [Candidatus Latescibacterota bacterium]